MSVLRDIFRRRARSILTISGIGVGVFALVVLGAVAENQNVYVERAAGYYSHSIVVIEKDDANFFGMANGKRPLSAKMADRLRAYSGVRAAFSQIAILFDDEYGSVIPPMVLSIAPGSEGYQPWTISEGRKIAGDESGVAVVGPDLAKQLNLDVGKTIDVRGKKFSVAGILDRTYINLVDSSVYVSLADAQRLYFASLPEAFRASVKPEDLAVQIEVYAKPNVNPDTVAEGMNRDIEGIRATGPTAMMKTLDGLLSLFNAVLWSIAAIALLISGLSIINTMTMAVSERTREIGVKRALGASRWRIAREVLTESAVMGGLGGLGGLVVGTVVALALNSAAVAKTGTTMFLLTGRLGIGAIVFAVVLGTLGGLYPARYASRMDPAAAIAYE